MPSFSASDAALEGVQLLRRHWRIAVGWAVFNLLAMGAVVIAFVIVGVVAATLAGVDSATLGATVGAPVIAITPPIVWLLTGCAVHRLILRPEERGFLYLRVGPDEVRSLVALLVLSIGAAALALASVAAGRAVLPVAPRATFGVAVAAAVLAYGLSMRFGLVLPICVAEGRIDFARSWRLTRGQGWALVGMSLLSICLALLLSVLVWGGFFVLTLAVVGFRELGELAGPEGFKNHTGLFLLQAIAPFLLSPFVVAITWAPWAEAYRVLTAQPVAEPEIPA